jgi:hypothetical protein
VTIQQSPEESRAAYVAAMGPELGAHFHVLLDDLLALRLTWEQHRILFAHSEERVETLRRIASVFFGLTQDLLWEGTLLRLSRFTDKSESRGQSNLTADRLPGLISDVQVQTEVRALVDAAQAKARFARNLRNRHIAHRDLRLALDLPTGPLAEGTEESVADAIVAAEAVLIRVHDHYLGFRIDFGIPGAPHDAADLMRVLRNAGWPVG